MSLKDIKKAIKKDGIPIYRDRAVIVRETKRLVHQGPTQFRAADRATKIAVITVFVFVIAVFVFLFAS